MPTHKVKGGKYQWGKSGKVYPTKQQADKQGRAIYASGWREKTHENKGYETNKKMEKQLIRLTESDLKRIIEQSVKSILKEGLDYRMEALNLLAQLKEEMGADQLCDRLASRLVGAIDHRGLYETLMDIKNIDCPSCE